jgi:hypothetical protein
LAKTDKTDTTVNATNAGFLIPVPEEDDDEKFSFVLPVIVPGGAL